LRSGAEEVRPKLRSRAFRKLNGAQLTAGQVMFEYAQDPLSPPVQPDKQQFRFVKAGNGSFKDWFGPHDAHVYRFNLA